MVVSSIQEECFWGKQGIPVARGTGTCYPFKGGKKENGPVFGRLTVSKREGSDIMPRFWDEKKKKKVASKSTRGNGEVKT